MGTEVAFDLSHKAIKSQLQADVKKAMKVLDNSWDTSAALTEVLFGVYLHGFKDGVVYGYVEGETKGKELVASGS